MARYRVQEAAGRRIDDIYVYTRATWGEPKRSATFVASSHGSKTSLHAALPGAPSVRISASMASTAAMSIIIFIGGPCPMAQWES